jgi:hypothetical protein
VTNNTSDQTLLTDGTLDRLRASTTAPEQRLDAIVAQAQAELEPTVARARQIVRDVEQRREAVAQELRALDLLRLDRPRARLAVGARVPAEAPRSPSGARERGGLWGSGGCPGIALVRPCNVEHFQNDFRDGRAARPGRPRVDAVAQRQKAAERARAYRARQHVAQLAEAEAALAALPEALTQ